MKTLLHYATCPAWDTGDTVSCTCFSAPPWRIRKEPAEAFPWRIWRRTADFNYEPLMRCSRFEGAVELVAQLIWLRNNALHRESNV